MTIEEYLSSGVFDIHTYYESTGRKTIPINDGVRILVDGAKVDYIFYADAINGFLDVYLVDSKKMHYRQGDEVANKRIHGKVEFKLNGKTIEIKG